MLNALALVVDVGLRRSGALARHAVCTAATHRLGQYLGHMPQVLALFAGTVGENIARLLPAVRADIVAAARRAFAHEMILQLPQGYDTDIGEEGRRLSAGQRLGLARALFGNPRLVVFDEPNAYLDGEGEIALLKAMQGLKAAEVAQIIISHKVSLLRQVDTMLVLRGGEVALLEPTHDVLPRLTRRESSAVTTLYAVAAVEEQHHGSA